MTPLFGDPDTVYFRDEFEEALHDAREVFAAGHIDVDELEREVGLILEAENGGERLGRFLSPFPPMQLTTELR